ncbi:MAG TPA: hypothetical protein VF862_09590, partial [Gemmatimonadales bacterium]
MSSLRLWSLACLGLAVGGCSPTPTEGPDAPAPNLGKAKPPSLPTVTVAITPTSPGLLPDGSPYVVTPGSDGSVEVRPACSTRSIDLQGMVPAIDGLDR